MLIQQYFLVSRSRGNEEAHSFPAECTPSRCSSVEIVSHQMEQVVSKILIKHVKVHYFSKMSIIPHGFYLVVNFPVLLMLEGTELLIEFIVIRNLKAIE